MEYGDYIGILSDITELSENNLMRRRNYPVPLYRAMIYAEMRRNGESLPSIARQSGYNHATVIHGIRKLREALQCGNCTEVSDTFKEYVKRLGPSGIRADVDRTKTLYLSGRISGETFDALYHKFYGAKDKLESMGYAVVNPLDNGLSITAPHAKQLRKDLELLEKCNVLVLLNGTAKASAGMKAEMGKAREMKIPIKYYREIVK